MQMGWKLEKMNIIHWLAKFMFIEKNPAKPNQAPLLPAALKAHIPSITFTHGPLHLQPPHISPTATAIMTPIPRTYRPQTLKQAKRAFRKSGGEVRLSESEKAAIERRVELQERADRINEREARRKANLKKREEKRQREKEARHRMGISTPPSKQGIQVGPSQLHLSDFMCAGVKRKRESIMKGVAEEAIIQKQEEPVAHEQQKPPIEPVRAPQPLETLPPNASSTYKMPPQIANANANSSKVRDLALQENRTLSLKTPPPRLPLQAKSGNPIFRQKSSAENKDINRLQAKSSYLQKPQLLPMDPPPQRQSVQHIDTGSTNFKKPSLIRFPLKPPKQEPIADDNLDDFFVSNTQIQRELSPPLNPPTKPQLHLIPTIRPPTPPPLRPPPTANEDAAHLLSLISTQDLDFSFDLTQKPQPPAAAPKISSCSSGSSSEEGEEEEDSFPDTELDSIVLEFSLESPIEPSHPSSTTSTSQHHRPLKTDHPPPSSQSSSHYSSPSDDAPTPTYLYKMLTDLDEGMKKARPEAQQGQVNDWDTFELELSTQDLKDLGS